MREIKFRGKRIDNGEWVYGYLCNDYSTGELFIQHESNKYEYPKWLAHVIDPESVGQFIEAHGKDYYEGDISKIGSDLYLLYWSKLYLQWRLQFIGTKRKNAEDIAWTKTEGFLKVWGDISLVGNISMDSIEIVGNRWDNLDLLK